MAGIITDVSEDIQKLQRIKAEIADVKKELKGIDILVRLDFKEDIEARLKSLMGQYNEVVLKIAKVEGEAMLAAKKIDEAINGISSDPLKSFDAELLKMCSNLNKYFDELLAKVESMSSLLQVGKTGIDVSTSNNAPTQQLEELRSKNSELTEQLRTQKEEIKRQQEEWNKLANAIKTNNVSAIEQYKQSTTSSFDAVKGAKAELKGLSKELYENVKYYEKLIAQSAAYSESLANLRKAQARGVARVTVGASGTSVPINDEIDRLEASFRRVRENQKGISNEVATQRRRQAELNEIIEQGNEKHLRTRTLIMDSREQLIQMRASGLQNTPQYQQSAEELGKMRRQMVLVNAEMAYLSNPNKNLATLKAGLSGIASSASLVVGVMGLVNQKNEEMMMLQTKMQSLLGIILGLEGSYNMIKKSSILMLALENMQRKASITAMALERKAKTANITLTWSEIAAQKALSLVAKFNPYLLLATAVLTVVGGLWLLIEANKTNINIQERVNSTLEGQKKHYDDLKNKVNGLISIVKDEASTRFDVVRAYKQLQDIMPGVFKNMDIETLKLMSKLGLLKDINKESNKSEIIGAKTKVIMAQDKYDSLNNSINTITENGGRISPTDIQDLSKAFIELQAARKVLLELEKIQLEADKEKNKPKVLNKSHWASQLEESNITLESIASEQKKILDKAAENPRKDLYKLGIDKATVDSYKQAIKDKAEAEKELKVYENPSKQDSAAEKLRKQQEKEKQLQQKQSEELLSLQRSSQQNEINLMEEGSEKRLKQIELDYQKEIDAIKKQEKEWSEANKGKLTQEQSQGISKAYNDAEAKRNKDITDTYKTESDAMRNYLKEYGTFLQQKLAIAEEYAEKIKKAQNEGERLALAKERDASLTNVDVKAAQQAIDWQSVFGDLGMMLQEQIQPTIDNLKVITQSDQFKNSPVEDQQKIYDILSQLERQSGTLGKDMFKDVARDLEAYRNSQNAYNAAIERQTNAFDALTKAQEKLKLAQENGGDVEAAQKVVDEAQESFNQTSESVKTLGEKANENAQALQTSSEKARGALEGLASGLNKLKSGSLSQAFDGVKDIGKTIGGKIGDAVSKIDPTGIISAALGIMDILKEGISSIFVSLQDTLYGAIEGILDDVFSGDIIVEPIKNMMSHLGNIINTVTFGGFNSWFGIGGNGKEVAEVTERLTNSNERLKDAVDELKDEISKTGGWKAIDAAKQAKVDQETINKQTSQILEEQMGYHGSHHSNAYYWNLGRNDYANINKSLADYLKKNPNANTDKNSVYSLEDIYKLTPEQMDYIRTYNVEMWEKMLDQGKYDKSEYWENYADLAGELKEITDALKETLTQTSFNSLRDSFIDSLMDMNKSAEDFADDFKNYLMKSILNAKISDLLDDDLQKFYDKWANYAESGNEITESEQNELSKDWDELTKKGIEIRDQISEFTGYTGNSSSQSSSGKSFQSMSQDTGNELNGRFTAFQISNEEIKNQAIIHTDLLSSINEKMSLLDLTKENLPILTAPNYPNFADRTKEIIASNYQTPVNVIFPDAKLDALTSEVSSLKGIVDEMRAFQIGQFPDITEGVAKIAKNIPVSNTKLENINNGIKRFNGR